MKNKLKTALKIFAAIAVAALFVLLCILLVPWVLSLREPQAQESFRAFIDSLGALGIAAMFLLQALQIVLAFIPGEPIEILMGMMYGTLGGLVLSLLGVAAGQALVFFLIKRFGIKLAGRFVNVEKFQNLKFLKDPAKREGLIFLLYFLPGTPKDILTYFAPFTGIAFIRFILIATFARIPSVVSSTWAGATLSEGSLIKSAVIFAVTGAVGLVGIFVHSKITGKKSATQEDTAND